MGRGGLLRGYVSLNIDKRLLHEVLLSMMSVPKSLREAMMREGLYLKPFHVIYKNTSMGEMEYRYYGRYWYRVITQGHRRRLIYLGSGLAKGIGLDFKPEAEGFSFVAYRHRSSPVFVKRSVYRAYPSVFRALGLDTRSE